MPAYHLLLLQELDLQLVDLLLEFAKFVDILFGATESSRHSEGQHCLN
jgi:hypothetical protein